MPYVEDRSCAFKTDDIFVVYPIKQESIYENTEISNNKKVFRVNNKITVGFNKRLVHRELTTSFDVPKYRYIDLINLDSLFVRDDILSSELYYSIYPRENLEEYGLPINIRELASNMGILIDEDEVKTYHIIDLFKRINKMDKDHEPVVLSYELREAEKQIDSIFGKTNSNDKNAVIEKK